MTFACALAPLDQSATSLGWHQGSFARSPCPLLSSCTSRQEGLQFRADAGTPVVAPFDGRLSAGVLTAGFSVSPAISVGPPRVRISGVAITAPTGPIQKGALLGRVSSSRGATFELLGGSMEALFGDLGLDVVGGQRPAVAGYALTPAQGGRLLVRASGPADCARGALGGHGALHGPALIEGWRSARYLQGLGSDVAPAGYVEPDASVYGRFGRSAQTNTSPLAPPGAGSGSGGLWGLVGWITVGGLALWAARR